MTSKRWARRALVFLAAGLTLCALFGRTLETMTMPRVKRAATIRGRLETRIPIEGVLDFSESVEVRLAGARQLPVVVERVHVRPGDFVQAGDALLTCYAPTYDERMKTLRDKYLNTVEEMTLEYASHIRIKQSSVQNDLTRQLLACAEALYMARYEAYAVAASEGCALAEDIEATDAYPRTQAALSAAREAQAAYDQAAAELSKLYRTGEGQVSNSVYEYLLKIDAYRRDIDALLRDMAALNALNAQVETLLAPHSGYVLTVGVEQGNDYSGATAALTMSAEGAAPVLRADISRLDTPVRVGDRVTLPSNAQTVVSEVVKEGGGKRYLHIQLGDADIEALGGMDVLSARDAVPLTLVDRAEATTTLLPASAVRTGSDGQSYVYRVDALATGGLLSSGGLTLVKMPVTVLEKGEQTVSVAEELLFATIAYQEDRPLREGQRVLEYTD